MHQERASGSLVLDDAWATEALRLAPATWPALKILGLVSASSFEALNDLGPGELAEELEALLGKAPEASQFTEFCELVTASGSFAGTKRRLVVAAAL